MALYYMKTKKNEDIISQCPSLTKRKFYPSIHLKSPFLQIVSSSLLELDPNLIFEEEFIRNDQNIEFGPSLWWVSQVSKTQQLPNHALNHQQNDIKPAINQKAIQTDTLIVILPGLTGGPQDAYIHQVAAQVLQQGYTPVVYNKRMLSTRLTFDSDKFINLTDDLSYTLNYIKSQYPQYQKIYGIGHSYGSHVLLDYLGREKENSLIDAGVSIANPFDQAILIKNIKGTVYDFLLAKVMAIKLQSIKDCYLNVPKHWNVDVPQALRAVSVSEFEDHFTKNLYGYSNLQDYHREFGCIKNFGGITVPVLCINSKDDPISHYSAIPVDRVKDKENVYFAITERGGHVSWVQGFRQLNAWYTTPSIQFLNAINRISNTN